MSDSRTPASDRFSWTAAALIVGTVLTTAALYVDPYTRRSLAQESQIETRCEAAVAAAASAADSTASYQD